MDEDIDPEQLEKQKKLWKLFGRETQAGKELFSLYNKAQKPKINYPKPKPKTQKQIDSEIQKNLMSKKCPQKTVIDYPQVQKKSPHTFHPIDFIPKRKAESVIRVEIEEYKQRRAKQIPANRGVDRQVLVKKLQEKFNMQSGGLPKQLPGVNNDIEFDEKKIKQKAKERVERKYKNYTQPIKKEEKKEKKINQNDELDHLFEEIVKEIDQRQKYLDSIDHLEEPELKGKIKKQMIERIAELQKITELKKR